MNLLSQIPGIGQKMANGWLLFQAICVCVRVHICVCAYAHVCVHVRLCVYVCEYVLVNV